MRNSTSTAQTAQPFDGKDLAGLKFFKPLEKLLSRLHSEAAHPNRKLHYDGYISLLLLYFFNPIIKSLRDNQKVSELEKVAEDLGIRRASLGSLSEAAQVFDPEPLEAIIRELAGQAFVTNGPPRPKGVPEDLEIIAADGSLLDALPRMMWALWLGNYDHAVKIHLQFNILRGTPVEAELTHGNGNEREILAKHLKAGQMYVLDRGYVDYTLYQQIIGAKSSFVARLKGNSVYEVGI